jgi:hypothetical protein
MLMAVDMRLGKDKGRLHGQRQQGNQSKARMSPQEAHRISRGGGHLTPKNAASGRCRAFLVAAPVTAAPRMNG